MVIEENDCHSHIFELLFSSHSKTMMLKTKVDIHVLSAVEKLFLWHAITKNIVSDIEPNVADNQEKKLV